MTILAGIMSRSLDIPIANSHRDALIRLISRFPSEEVTSFGDDSIFFAKVDINAYGQPAFRIDPSGSLSMLAGEPILTDGSHRSRRTRSEDLKLLHQEFDQQRWELLDKVQGVFCAAHYQPALRTLTLVVDKLGIRPIYFWLDSRCVVFATALRILEQFSGVPKTMDLRAVTEITCLGYPLGTRTPYVNVELLRPGEIVQISDQAIFRSQYWRWDKCESSKAPETELLEEAYGRFEAAIKQRLRNDTVTCGFLSGGLDSRCTVGGIRSLNAAVHTFNFAPPNSQDRIFAREIAERLGTHHQEFPLSRRVDQSVVSLLAEVSTELRFRRGILPERPKMVWTGDGGSVGAGYVYLSDQMSVLLRSNKADEATDIYLRKFSGFPVRRLLTPSVYKFLSDVPREGIREELSDIQCDDPARSFHLFLMLNDQRRHLSGHFEDIDLNRLELQTPFFDSYFLQLMLTLPIDICIYHRFYSKWLRYFPPCLTEVPWQVYPNHEPCPLPVDQTLMYQWSKESARERARLQRPRLFEHALEIGRSERFPRPIMRRGYLLLAAWIYRMGLRNYEYVIEAARIYDKHWTICKGNYELSP